MSFEELDKILDNVEAAYTSLVTRKNMSASIERWRWDQPIITLSWTSADFISRNIHAYVREDRELLTEVNAWYDEDLSHNGRVRHWKHKTTDSLPISADSEQIDQAITSAFDQMSRWGKKDLSDRTVFEQAAREGKGGRATGTATAY